MRVAQSLYENGYITYMRTDSVSLSQQAIQAAHAGREAVRRRLVPETPRAYAGKSKNAQEAHEAIRPSGEVFRTPSELQNVLRGSEFKLYDLIWKRTVASQMADAKARPPRSRSRSVRRPRMPPRRRTDRTVAGTIAEFTASGTVITFRGFLAAYERRPTTRSATPTRRPARPSCRR